MQVKNILLMLLEFIKNILNKKFKVEIKLFLIMINYFSTIAQKMSG